MKPVDERNPDLLTVPETAAFLRLKTSTIRAWVCKRKIPYVKLGRMVRIRRSDAEAFIEARIVPVSGISAAGADHAQR
jgi:excisionase family DNA binding protein